MIKLSISCNNFIIGFHEPDSYLRDMIRLFYLIAVWLLCIAGEVSAQYVKVEVGIDGFTCSMCGMSVEKSIRRLSFVEDVQMDLNNNTAVITFRKDREISIQKIADEVYRSGFSVRSIEADYNFPATTVHDYFIVAAGNEEFHFLGTGETSINGVTTIVFLNKKLISKKEYTHWEEWIKNDVKKNGKKDNVCYVTLVRG